MNVFAKSILTILIIILISETAFSQESGIYFGIHETCKLKDLPESFAVKAKEVLSETENPKNPAIIGYINADAVDILDDLQKDLVSE